MISGFVLQMVDLYGSMMIYDSMINVWQFHKDRIGLDFGIFRGVPRIGPTMTNSFTAILAK